MGMLGGWEILVKHIRGDKYGRLGCSPALSADRSGVTAVMRGQGMELVPSNAVL